MEPIHLLPQNDTPTSGHDQTLRAKGEKGVMGDSAGKPCHFPVHMPPHPEPHCLALCLQINPSHHMDPKLVCDSFLLLHSLTTD